jgi:hypothetical protein
VPVVQYFLNSHFVIILNLQYQLIAAKYQTLLNLQNSFKDSRNGIPFFPFVDTFLAFPQNSCEQWRAAACYFQKGRSVL